MRDPSAATPEAAGPRWPRRLRFGSVELQPRERRLLVDGTAVAIGARAFNLLLALLRCPDALRTKDELLDEVWPELVVEEANLTVQISALRRVLGGACIATIPGRGYRFCARIEVDDEAVPAPAASPTGTSTAPTLVAPRALIGRDADLERLRTELLRPGCITLTGAAGVGKTSLARALAQGHARGAVWVDLAPLGDGSLVAPALAHALELTAAAPVPTPASVATALGSRLLLLDNAEHLIDAAATLVAALLAAAPDLTVLVTSQQPLSIAGERVQRIEPLALERADDASDAPSAAAALFLARVRAASHRFVAAPGMLPLVHEICQRLDGIPLALEMAAARVPALGLQGVRDALSGERFALLTTGYRDAGGRHRTLKSALDWSHGLLGADEQQLFRRLAVFSGGFSLELAVAVAGDEARDRWAVIDTLAALVDRSLVDADDADPPRYRLLETLREYAAQRLADAGETEAQRSRHAQALLDLFERAQTDLGQRPCALREHDNAREAAAWALRHDPALALRLSRCIARAATFSVWRSQAAAWLDACEPVLDDPRIERSELAQWWVERARQHLMLGDPEATVMARRALMLYRALDVPLGMFNALQAVVRGSHSVPKDLAALCAELELLAARLDRPLTHMSLQGTLAHAACLRGDDESALMHRRLERELALQHGYVQQAEAAETNIAAALIRLGRHDEALAVARDLLERPGAAESVNLAYAWKSAITALVAMGRHDEALRELPRALAVLRRCALPLLVDVVPAVLLALGRPRAAALLAAQALAQLHADGRLDGVDQAQVQGVEDAARAARAVLGEEAANALTVRGRSLDAAQADRLVTDAAAGGSDAD